ncbi:MAG: DUF3604 domain-containing protein [Porticoccaceae bacterium]|jgi:hypothetical protein|nr:MAG: hypothetical protein ABS23_03225 [SAR92 bacterium BACL16 MAG-120619-bin48]MDP4743566.1 DUF3604 domain-containing protein [Porticoccaceae bacterium]MDP4752404.1 DUF3604 domain-containing protein [Porticoccaceae bacterium]
MYKLNNVTALGVLALSVSLFASAEDASVVEQKPSYSTPVREHVSNLYWGDLHLHTKLSADAYTMETRLTSDEAYQFARGGTVTADNGMPVRLRRPLDFLAVTDHSEYLGVFAQLAADDPTLKGWKMGEEWQTLLREGRTTELAKAFANAIQTDAAEYQTPGPVRSGLWASAAAVADKYNEPGLFTAFVGYEWTSMISGDNLHRVVIYKDGAEVASKRVPFSAQDSTDPEDLWSALSAYEESTGGEVLAIAHNGNVSNGRMFSPTRLNGKPLDANYAAKRARWEPVYETTQIKGDGETHPYLSADDEFADYETWDEGNISLTQAKTPDMLQYEYSRSALKEGLRHEANLGVNPFKFGLIGSTDSHTGMSTTNEDNFFGKFAHDEPSADRTEKRMANQLQKIWKLVSSGLVAVWSEENTRESLFQAIKRREVYATTGTRIQLRFFGGWQFDAADVLRADFATLGYQKGVPMGGDLTRGANTHAPTFMVAASRDPDGANLDRVQIVKGWLDAQGNTQEKVFDVAWSAGRTIDAKTGKLASVGSTVDVANTTYSNSIGAAELATVWTDPEFNASQNAFYYARVLQIPTPRWTAYDAKYFGATIDPRAAMVTQDRAYSSPIWYTP